MKTYKGFNKDMTCKGFQYEQGKEYEHAGDVEVCKKGFHACEYPLDCFNYYTPAESVFHEVEQSGDISKSVDGEKVASSKIKIGVRLDIAGLVNASIEYIKERPEKTISNHSEEKQKANSATGDWSANSATGARSANSATGYGSANLTTGEESSNAGMGDANISIGWGKDNKCKGKIGSYLVLSEWGAWDGNKYPLIIAKMVIVDGEKIKEDTFYKLKKGRVVEAK